MSLAGCQRTWSALFFHREAREENLLTSRFLALFAVQTGVLRLETLLSDKMLGLIRLSTGRLGLYNDLLL